VAFIGLLGLFNSWKLEMRQVADTNAELLFQNGMIISVTLVTVCLMGCFVEISFLFQNRKKKPEPLYGVDYAPTSLDVIDEVVKEEE
jgi:hypothetical protein